MARLKPKTTVIADKAQAEAAMMELGGLGRDITAIELDAQENIDLIKANAVAEMEPLQVRKKELEDALCTYATLNKGKLFKERKSLETPFGVFGWRKATRLLTASKVTLADVLERLRELGIREAIRTKESVDKTVLADWPDSRLEGVGMKRVSKDEFYIEIHEDTLGADQ
ncbi:host-nuclease inhibitor Gam family protein [Pseudodesulfovibrio pelocollis]|uniref:host-nuclease inhibitor Gam family protein n=1 Tax=Pseudodesulfovibrio pelocollis TaxID=3051432 RepID=UPI00255AC8A1|nr:host-nuclease inhibitor Gam family protein [Pseudodesulfovibrio sp. SB368]